MIPPILLAIPTSHVLSKFHTCGSRPVKSSFPRPRRRGFDPTISDSDHGTRRRSPGYITQWLRKLRSSTEPRSQSRSCFSFPGCGLLTFSRGFLVPTSATCPTHPSFGCPIPRARSKIIHRSQRDSRSRRIARQGIESFSSVLSSASRHHPSWSSTRQLDIRPDEGEGLRRSGYKVHTYPAQRIRVSG